MMKLKDIIQEGDYIEERMFVDVEEGPTDILYGYCKYIGGVLLSVDGDNYSLEDEIVNYADCSNLVGKKFLQSENCSRFLTVFLDNNKNF